MLTFYVKDIQISTEFYEKIFDQKPKISYPTYVAWKFNNGLTFSLWLHKEQNYLSEGVGNRTELAFMFDNEEQVNVLYNKWKALGIPMEQELTKVHFGLTFVALDPDGYSIRGVCN